MPSLDLSVDYKKVKDKVTANQSYNDLKTKYDDITKRAGDNLEQLKSKKKFLLKINSTYIMNRIFNKIGIDNITIAKLWSLLQSNRSNNENNENKDKERKRLVNEYENKQ